MSGSKGPVARRVAIVEDDPAVVDAIQAAISGTGYTVCGHADRGEGVAALVRRQRPGVVLMDIELRGALDGIGAAERLRRQRYDGSLIYLTAHAGGNFCERARSTGPHAYVLKPFSPRQLVVALEVASARREEEALLRRELDQLRAAASHAHGLLCAALGEDESGPSGPAGPDAQRRSALSRLSPRELDVFERAVRGESLEHLAGALFISPHTARNHLAAIYRKLDVSSRLELSTTYMQVVSDDGWRAALPNRARGDSA